MNIKKKLCFHKPVWVQRAEGVRQYKCSKCGAGISLPLNKERKLEYRIPRTG